ncbi:hypothetical protein BH09BAC3_BH09BAC3_05750 [soil metagenome]
MTEKALSKKLMLVAGILAAIIVLFSQAFQKETTQILSKIRPDMAATKDAKPADAEKKVVIATSTEAVTSGTAVQVEDTNPSLIREIIFDENSAAVQPVILKAVLVDFFKTLFRVVISPQAP